MNYRRIEHCRICGNEELVTVVNLGSQYLTGVFPKSKDEIVGSGPLELVKCQEDKEGKYCGLVQLHHTYELDQLYGSNYGYRSGLNRSMVDHLHNKVRKIVDSVSLSKDDLILDIGSNDSTLLQAYPNLGLTLVGIDPTGEKFRTFYPGHIKLIPEFFPSKTYINMYGDQKAKVITSISMFYDLDDPLAFMRNVYEALDDNGVWVFEQSYLPAMLTATSYDTICHEHLEYYALKQIKYMTDMVGLKIIKIEFNDVNGGSFSVTAAKLNPPFKPDLSAINKILKEEAKMGVAKLETFSNFQSRIVDHKDELLKLIQDVKRQGKKVFGYGASTKGNVILQYCGLTERDIPFIAEVNEDKFGRYTPGSLIPIISEQEARLLNPDYFMVLPWHFRRNIIEKERAYLGKGGRLIFPLPRLDVV